MPSKYEQAWRKNLLKKIEHYEESTSKSERKDGLCFTLRLPDTSGKQRHYTCDV